MSLRGATAFTLSAGAVVWSALLVVAAFTVDVYSGSSSEGGELGATLVEVNGIGAALTMAIPLVLCVAAFLLQRRVCHGRRGRTAGWIVAGLLYALSVISGFSVGLFVMPAAVALLAAQAIVPSPR